MNSPAIPAAPPAIIPAGIGNAAVPASNDNHFGDTLRKTQASPETQAHGDTASNNAVPQATGGQPDIGKKDAAKGDAPAGKQTDAKVEDRLADPTNALPIAPPVVLPPPATPRQVLAADGNALPADSIPTPVAVTTTPAPTLPIITASFAAIHAPIVASRMQAHVASASDAVSDAEVPEATTAALANIDTNLASATPISLHDINPDADSGGGNDSTAQRQGSNDFAAQLTQLVGAHAAQPANAAPAPAPAPLQLAMQAKPEQPQPFAQETAQHIAWLAGKGIDKAEIQLNPRKLGPISIEISSHRDRIDVSFAVQHPQTVHALQQTLPQLHDMLAQHGLNLGQASVGHQAPGQQHAAFAQQLDGSGRGNGNNTDAESPHDWRPLRIATPGRVDDFA